MDQVHPQTKHIDLLMLLMSRVMVVIVLLMVSTTMLMIAITILKILLLGTIFEGNTEDNGNDENDGGVSLVCVQGAILGCLTAKTRGAGIRRVVPPKNSTLVCFW